MKLRPDGYVGYVGYVEIVGVKKVLFFQKILDMVKALMCSVFMSSVFWKLIYSNTCRWVLAEKLERFVFLYGPTKMVSFGVEEDSFGQARL